MPSQPGAIPADNSSPYLRDSALFEWANLSLGSDLVFTLAIAICLELGLGLGHPAAGMIAASGSLLRVFQQER